MPLLSRDEFDDLPAADPPANVTSNLVDPPSLNGYDIATGTICLVMTLTFFLIRVITKRFLLKSVYWEDWICAVAIALFVADVSIVLWAGAIGGGRHQWNTSINTAIELFRIANMVEILYCTTMLFAKTSILLQIRRVFSGLQHGAVRFITTALIWCNILFYIAAGLAFCFACWPREAIWDPFVPGRCIDTLGLFLVSSALNLVSDVMILLIPIINTWRLVLSTRKKLLASGIFATGGFACVAAIMRLLSTIGLDTASDLTYELMVIGLWSEAEIATVLICGCMPCLPRFLKFCAGCGTNQSYGSNSRRTVQREATHDNDRDTLRQTSMMIDVEKTGMSRVPDPYPISPIHPAFRATVERPRRMLLRPLLTIGLDQYQGPNLDSRDGAGTPPSKIEHATLPPPPPPKDSGFRARKASLSSRATSPQSQQALHALAGRFWRDAVDHKATAGGGETRRQQIEKESPASSPGAYAEPIP